MAILDITRLRDEAKGRTRTPLFEHQIEAIKRLNTVFDFETDDSKSGLLVFPTGAGKTYTTIRWLCDSVISKREKDVRIVWLAHAFHLLDQAFNTLMRDAPWITGRDTLNVKCVSSHKSHDNSFEIDWASDDIVIISTQTAIANYGVNALDQVGETITTNFEKFITGCASNRLLVVLDEAHHAPAYGCRNLLNWFKKTVPNLYLLGLTATPTYTDESRRGWLDTFFGKEPIYTADHERLIAQKILARPNFVQMPTGREYAVNDNQYRQLVEQHKDVQEIIERMANDSGRNDFIVQEYLKNRETYGKTLIFADWGPQCIYMEKKLAAEGVRVGSVFHHIDADPGSVEARNRRTSDDNKRILEEFRSGKLDVLINIKMLTEGTDVPDVKTVFITRQTASSILMTQMVGRGLRGEKAGGGPNKLDANVVLFVDEWKRLITWAWPELSGGTADDAKRVTERYPPDYVSIALIEEISRQINSGMIYQPVDYLSYLPDGWYEVNIVVDTSQSDMEEIQSFTEFVMVYEDTRACYKSFIHDVSSRLPPEWGKERLLMKEVEEQVEGWIASYFRGGVDHVGSSLDLDLFRVARHLAQNESPPAYYSFSERDTHDLDQIARDVIKYKLDPLAREQLLQRTYSKPGSLWKTFYKTPDRFKAAYFGAEQRQIAIALGTAEVDSQSPPQERTSNSGSEPTQAVKHQVFERDNYTCQACGAQGMKFRLQADHIVPVKMRGEADLNNLQTLCAICNNKKMINEINFKNHITQLRGPKSPHFLPRQGQEDVRRSLRRLVNFFYHCQAVCNVGIHARRSGKYYSVWEVELFTGNDPEWLLNYKAQLLAHIQKEFDCPHVQDIRILSV